MAPVDNFAYLLPFIFLVFGVVFIAADRWLPGAARYWGIGYCCAALGFCFPILGFSLPLEAQAIVSNILFFVAFFFYGHALLVRFARPPRLILRMLLALTGLALVAWFILVRQDLRLHLAAADAGLAILLGISVGFVWRHAAKPFDRLLVAMAALVVAETVVRVASLLVFTRAGDYASLDDFLGSDYAFLMQVAASIIGFLLALTVLGSVMADVVGGHRQAAEIDPLTNLLNRRGFDRAVPVAETGGFPSGAVVIGDIDHFKEVNDSFGHAAGDRVIIAFAKSLREAFHGAVAIARFGGEEFVVFLPSMSSSDAARMADDARLRFAGTDWAEHGIHGPITASFGVAATAPGDHAVHDAVGRADASLYAAKNSGRNRVVVEGHRLAEGAPPLRLVSSS